MNSFGRQAVGGQPITKWLPSPELPSKSAAYGERVQGLKRELGQKDNLNEITIYEVLNLRNIHKRNNLVLITENHNIYIMVGGTHG